MSEDISEVFSISDYSATISQGELIFLHEEIIVFLYESVHVSWLYVQIAWSCLWSIKYFMLKPIRIIRWYLERDWQISFLVFFNVLLYCLLYFLDTCDRLLSRWRFRGVGLKFWKLNIIIVYKDYTINNIRKYLRRVAQIRLKKHIRQIEIGW